VSRRLSATALLVALAVAGCGGSSAGTSSSFDADGSAPPASPGFIGPQAGSKAPTVGCVDQPAVAKTVSGTTDLSKKPEIEVPDGPPPCNLVVGDIVVGNGPAAKAGDQLTMKYVGVLYANGKQFDASWDSGQDYPVAIGTGAVIPGWDQGILGMKVGGRRQLIIPPDLAYGDQDQGAELPANSTLIFVVDLVKIG
jgi:peptidylprolyl isomerase